MDILFICTGHTCRSPMAQALFTKMCLEKGLDIKCGSAGVRASSSGHTNPNSVAALRELFGIDFDTPPRQLTKELSVKSDLIIAMNADIAAYAVQACGAPREKVFLMPRPISDPYGGDLETYKKCALDIKSALDTLAERLVQSNPEVKNGGFYIQYDL